MAITKIMHMKDCGGAYHGKHLKLSIDYITEGWKTQGGKLVGALNCLPGSVYEQMRETKKLFHKNTGRQGYHIVLSFEKGEVDPDTALEITGKFASRYLGSKYEVVYAVHDNTEHVHAHIIWNSVSFVDGKKYHYKKGDWEKDILPLVNDLCREYNLSVLELDGERTYAEKKEQKWVQGHSWNVMIRRDLDACILQAASYEEFLEFLSDKGYECKQGKYLAVKPPGMERFRRCSTLGEAYSEEQIRQRIEKENIRTYAREVQGKPKIIRCYVKKYRKAKMSGLQKKYYSRLYRIGKLKKQAYSKAWKYKDEILKLQKIQRQYLFLNKYEIRKVEELSVVMGNLKEMNKQMQTEKSMVYKARNRYSKLFKTAEEMEKLECAHCAFINGDNFFVKEHEQWKSYEQQLKNSGYTYEEIMQIKKHFKQEIAEVISKAAAARREMKNGEAIWQEIVQESNLKREAKKEKEISKEKRMQLVR